MKTFLKIILPLVVLLLGFGAKSLLIATGPKLEAQEPERQVPMVEVQTVQPATRTLEVLAYGEVRPRSTTGVVAEVPAKVLQVSDKLYRGSFFQKGDLLIELEDTDYLNAVAVAEAQWLQAQAALELEQAEAKVALVEWQQLGEGEAPSVVRREPQLQAARASIDAAEANLEVARTNLSRCRIVAPFDGRSLERNVEPGNYVAPGAPLANIYATDAAEVRLPLPADQLDHLGLALDGPAAPLDVRFEAELGERSAQWQGKLLRTEAAVDPATRMIEAIAMIEDPFRKKGETPALAPGMFLKATISGRPVEGVYSIPRHALLNGNRVRLADSNDTTKEVEVEVLQTTPTEALIHAGLEPGDRVILTPMALYLEGMLVTVVTTEEQES
ncbi:MAG: efflux RND transporter periplasmic adaptor subunit [Planctomycetota bacterium]